LFSGGGCSGMQYGFTFEEQGQEDDFVLEFDGIHLLIDSMSSQYLHGAEVDYTESLQGSQFSIKNPKHRQPVVVDQVSTQDNRRILWRLKDVHRYHQSQNLFGGQHPRSIAATARRTLKKRK
jgi:iron-sulfur cluster assembly accessory protein